MCKKFGASIIIKGSNQAEVSLSLSFVLSFCLFFCLFISSFVIQAKEFATSMATEKRLAYIEGWVIQVTATSLLLLLLLLLLFYGIVVLLIYGVSTRWCSIFYLVFFYVILFLGKIFGLIQQMTSLLIFPFLTFEKTLITKKELCGRCSRTCKKTNKDTYVITFCCCRVTYAT